MRALSACRFTWSRSSTSWPASPVNWCRNWGASPGRKRLLSAWTFQWPRSARCSGSGRRKYRWKRQSVKRGIPSSANLLRNVLRTLTPREEKIIKMRYGLEDGLEHTLEEVGQCFAVTRERIRQIEGKALRKLRHPSRSLKLKLFVVDVHE